MDEIHHPLRILALFNYSSRKDESDYANEKNNDKEGLRKLVQDILPEKPLRTKFHPPPLPIAYSYPGGYIPPMEDIARIAILFHDLLGDGEPGQSYANLYELEADLESRLNESVLGGQFDIAQTVNAVSYIVDGLDRKTIVDRVLWLGNKIQEFFNAKDIDSIEQFYSKFGDHIDQQRKKDKGNGYVYDDVTLIAEHITDMIMFLENRTITEREGQSNYDKTRTIYEEQVLAKDKLRNIFDWKRSSTFFRKITI